jgi:hypothetical protein
MLCAGPLESRSGLEPERSGACVPLAIGRRRYAVTSSTYGVPPGRLSTFVDDSTLLVDNLVDVVGVRAYCPTSAPLLRTVARVTALARGLGKPGRRLDRRGKTEVRRVRAKATPGAARL